MILLKILSLIILLLKKDFWRLLLKEIPRSFWKVIRNGLLGLVKRCNLLIIRFNVLQRLQQVLYVTTLTFMTIKRIMFLAIYSWYISIILVNSLLHKTIIIQFHLTFFNYNLFNYDMSLLFFITLLSWMSYVLITCPQPSNWKQYVGLVMLLLLSGRIWLTGFLNYSNMFLHSNLFTIIII